MSGPEDAYGTRKRAAFVSQAVSTFRPIRVLDFGCGTGEQLTIPLAEAHPEVQFVGVDPDARSIRHASAARSLSNLSFRLVSDLRPEERFSLIIASEVLEHVEAPAAFLESLRLRLHPGGCIVATVPNGYGPAELASLLESLLAVAGVLDVLRWIWRRVRNREAKAATDTLAVSPHVNFFSWRELHRVISISGLQPADYRPRTLLCGFGFDAILRGERVLRWNAEAADKLPAVFASDWMFLLVPASSPKHGTEHRRSWLARSRRRLNEKRWGLR